MKIIYKIVNFLFFLSVVFFVACSIFWLVEVMTEWPHVLPFTMVWLLSVVLMFLLAYFDNKMKSKVKEKAQ